MKKFLNNKFLVTVALFLFFLLLNCNSVRAESVLVTTDTYDKAFIDSHIDAGQSPFDAVKKVVDYYNTNYPDTITYSSSDLPKYGLLVKGVGPISSGGEDIEKYLFIFTSVPFRTDSANAGYWDWNMYYESSEEPVYSFGCAFNDGGLELSKTIDIVDTSISYEPDFGFYGGPGIRTLIASNYDVKSTDGNTTVFQQPTLRKATTLAPVIQKEKTKGTLQVVLKEIIQILPLIIVVLVSFLGLRKALKMLFQLLRRS